LGVVKADRGARGSNVLCGEFELNRADERFVFLDKPANVRKRWNGLLRRRIKFFDPLRSSLQVPFGALEQDLIGTQVRSHYDCFWQALPKSLDHRARVAVFGVE